MQKQKKTHRMTSAYSFRNNLLTTVVRTWSSVISVIKLCMTLESYEIHTCNSRCASCH